MRRMRHPAQIQKHHHHSAAAASADSLWLLLQVAATDDLGHVMLYSFVPYKHIMRWEYIGKSKAHHAKVSTLGTQPPHTHTTSMPKCVITQSLIC